MRTEMIDLLITAATNFAIAFTTGLLAALTAPGAADLPTKGNLIVAMLGGILAAAQTIRQAMGSTPERVNTLRAMINKTNPPSTHEDR